MGAGLALCGIAMAVLEARFPARRVFALGGMAALSLGAVQMGVHWATALAVSLPFAMITVLLLKTARRARINKTCDHAHLPTSS